MTKEKKCTGCGEVKGLECFSKNKNTRDGLQSWCKVCKKGYARKWRNENKEYLKDYYQENKEHLKECNRKYHQENKEYRKECNRKYRQENKEYFKDYYQENKEYFKDYYQENKEYKKECNRKWAEENPDKVNAIKARRRARKLRATPKWLTQEQDLEIKLIYKTARELEDMDGVKRHVDHIVPLKGKDVRGLHVPWNLQILTAEQNLSKNNSYSGWN